MSDANTFTSLVWRVCKTWGNGRGSNQPELLFVLGHAHGMPAIIVGERDGQIANEEQHGIGMFAQSVEQVEPIFLCYLVARDQLRA